MAFYFEEPSHTFSEYLLVPGYSSAACIPANVSLKTPLVKFKKGEEPAISINIPMVSAIMQSVSDDRMAVALAREGGMSFIYGSQSIESEAAMVARAKSYKAGFVVSDSNIKPDQTLADVLELLQKTGHSTMAVTEDGTATGKLLGVVTSRDYRVSRMDTSTKVSEFMTGMDHLVYAGPATTLKEANDIIWDHKLNSLPIVDDNGHLMYMVFRKDYDSHKENPLELLDSHKRYMVGAGINTRDYEERVPALVEAGADVLCIDSSEGFSEWQKRTLDFIRGKYGDTVKVGAGNVVDREGFRFLAEAGADFIKVGIGGGSICITREQKGIGRGQATALIDVAKARDEYFEETGVYVPICSDGGIVYDYHMTLALAMGADFLMLGRYFARFDESPTEKVNIDFIKVGIGGGSICITREQKGIGRGQATALIDVAKARDEYFEETGVYVPICSDGGIVYDYHMTLALAMGADFLMLGRYFARFDESPTEKVNINGSIMKEYWGEGSARARNWQRYDMGGAAKLSFVEGVDSYVPYAGSLRDNVAISLSKVRSTMCNCGALTIPELQQNAKLTLVSATSIVEGGAHDVVLKDNDRSNFPK